MNHTVRCLAWLERDGSWQSMCVDLSLSARADSLSEAKRQLSLQIRAHGTLQSRPAGAPSRALRSPLPWPRRWLVPLLYALAPTLRVQRYRETLPRGFSSA